MSNTGTYRYDKDSDQWVKVSDRANGNPDVHFRGEYFEPHFAKDGKPFGQEVRSKRHKQAIMKDLGISETGDKSHGSRM